MKLNWKAFFIALPIAVFIQAISIFIGISVYGESFNFALSNVVGILTGFVVFNIVNKSKPKSPSEE